MTLQQPQHQPQNQCKDTHGQTDRHIDRHRQTDNVNTVHYLGQDPRRNARAAPQLPCK
jgi:hypothetical protein